MNPFVLFFVKSSFVFAVLTLFYYFFLRKDLRHTSNRFFLLLIPLVSAVLPFINIEIPIAEVVKPILGNAILTTEVVSAPNLETASSETSVHPLWIFYIVGIAILFFRFLIGILSLRKLAAQSICTDLNGVRLVQSKKYISPFSFMNTIYISAEHHSHDAYKQILQHELAHVHQKHSWDIIYSHICCMICWFNPFVWWHQRLMKENHEYLADRAVINTGINPTIYQYQLVRTISTSQGISKLSTLSQFSNAQLLKKRIIMLNQGKRIRLRPLRYCMAISFLAITMVVSGQIKTVQVKQNAEIYQAYGGSIPNHVLKQKTLHVDGKVVDKDAFDQMFTKSNDEWLIECAIVYEDNPKAIFVHTSEEMCSQLVPAPPAPPLPPAPVHTPPPPPAPNAVSPPPPPQAPTAPIHWNGLDDWNDISSRKAYLREMKRQGATFWLNDETVDPKVLEKIDAENIHNTDVSSRQNNGKKSISIKVYTKQ